MCWRNQQDDARRPGDAGAAISASGDAAVGSAGGPSEVRCRKHQPHIGGRGDVSGARGLPEVAVRTASAAGAMPIANSAAPSAQERASISMAGGSLILRDD
jgi:hypothetical protein